ncbi:MAG: methylenetetrahydrofolate reductase [Chloroflexi bacterium]|nr:methylenetetrahydrofolate reductase [Chloroflexota bacterium]
MSTPSPSGRFATALAAGRFAVTTEVVPPRGFDAEPLRRTARRLRDLVVAANVTDNPGASVHLSALAAAAILQGEGLEPILQMTCRDRNRLALQADLLGAAAFGIHNLLCLRGDPIEHGPEPEAKSVFDLDTVGLLRTATKLRDECRLLGGERLPAGPPFFPGAAETPADPDLDNAMARLAAKVEAGALFVQTQLVFDVPAFATWLAAVRARGLHDRVAILAGVGLVRRLETARFLQIKVPGVVVPEAVVERFAAVAPDDRQAVGLRLATETIVALRALPGLRGVHLMPFGWYDGLEAVVRDLG